MKRFCLALLLLCSSAAYADTRVVDLGPRKVRVRVEGSGPTVILEAGFRATLDSWAPVIPDIAKFARVFAYDRAGLGGSDAVAGERDYVTMMTELHDLLQHEKIPPPYMFAGHSYGGALARVFYKLYPSEVASIVFVDPMSEEYIRTDPDQRKNIQLQEDSLRGAPPGVLAEWAFLRKETESGYSILAKYGEPNVPMALITATIDRPPKWRTKSIDSYGRWVVKRDDSLLIVTPSSGHLVMRDEPDLVTRAVRTMLYPNPIVALRKAAGDGGGDAAIAVFRDQLARYPKDSIRPSVLNALGYSFLAAQLPADAVKVFAFNVATFPSDANAYDSLGEAYAANGNRELALASYRKSLELDPSNDNARRMIERLQKEKP